MASIVTKSIDPLSPEPWMEIVRAVRSWCGENGLGLRDTQVLVPFAQHLPLARAAWARGQSWVPRTETTQTLAHALRPPVQAQPQQISFDVATDRLSAAQLLGPSLGRSAWAQGDAPGHALAVAQLTETAHALARAAAAVPPSDRDAHVAKARLVLKEGAAPGAPGHSERLLAQVALEWAALAPPPQTDALFDHPAAAWVLIEAGGPDALARAVAAQAAARGTPVLLLRTDVPDHASSPQGALEGVAAHVQQSVCDDFETEAQCAAAQVLSHLRAGEVPVALVAQDRLLVRRVRALLARQQVPLCDETGWTLSTTRAAALVASVLRLVDADVGADDLLDALKSCASPFGQVGAWPAGALNALESAWRRQGWRRPQAVQPARLSGEAAALWHHVQAVVQGVDAARPRALASWLQALDHLLQGLGVVPALLDDDAGRQVWQRLHPADGWRQLAPASLDLRAFSRWLDDLLEQTSFIPATPPDAQVFITPLARMPLRPFAAVVFPGADEHHLGAWPTAPALLSASAAAALGMPSQQQQRDAQWLAFCQLLRAPRLTLLRRNADQGETLDASPFVLALSSALAGGAAALRQAPQVRVERVLQPQEPRPPEPAAPAHLPARLTASSCEALRQCPYRFFALHMLQLRSEDELDEEVAKRDYGTWLHEVLLRFHQRRAEQGAAGPEEEASALHQIADAVQAEQALDSAEFLPYAATFRRFVPRYLQWLARRDGEGSLWLDGERSLTALPDEWAGTAMFGVIDRVDSVPGDDGPVTQLIDYKTGSSAALRQKTKQPLEDTQLAFYAGLMAQQSEAVGALGAAYVTLDDGDAVQTLVHVDVEHSAEQLLQGIAGDLKRLRQGAPLRALGEGAVCETCEARGLCRRDEWSGRVLQDGEGGG